MTPEELLRSILYQAFQGKLTKQLSTDDSVDNVIALCKKDKELAISKGKFRKEEFLGHIDSEDFNIPSEWALLRISDMALFQEGPGVLAKDFRNSGIPLIRISGMQNSVLSLEGCNYLDEDMVETKWSHFRLELGDIVISSSASMDKVCEVFEDTVGAIPYTGQIRFQMYGGIIKEYFKWYVQSPYYVKQINEQQSGAAIKHYGPTHLRKMYIPVAPIEEQKRIVAKIEELLPLVDKYADAYNRLEELNKTFPGDLKKSILQYAIQGKLVEQRPEEGTADDLYAQIQAEKQRLIKKGKIKKEKPLPDITDDEIPFDIPESWKWCYFGSLFAHNTGKAMNASAKKTEKSGMVRKFITTSNVYWNEFDFSNVKEMFFTDDELERCTVTKGDLLICEGGAYYGRTAIWNFDYDICFQNHVHRARPFTHVEMMYFYYVMYLYRNSGMIKSKGTAMPGLSSDTLHKLIIPVPPVDEQKRIVKRIEEILSNSFIK